MLLAPRGDALDDEQPLAGLHEPEPPRFSNELVTGAGARDSTLESRALGFQRPDVGPAALELVLRVEIRVCRLPVEERDENEPSDREQPDPTEAHASRFGGAPGIPTRLRDVDLDHVRRAGQVDRRARGEDDAVAGVDRP